MTGQMAEMYSGWLTNAATLTYQGFYASFDVSGDPNTLLKSAPLKWSPVDGRCYTEKAQQIVEPNKGASPIQDFLVTQLEHVPRQGP
ncbi:hypothetical protein VCV18_010690 [Metarhizium anisopliae]